MAIADDRKLKFINRKNDAGRISKMCVSDTLDYMADYIDQFHDVDVIDEIISELDLAINGQFSQIDDPDIGGEFHNVDITPTGVTYRSMDVPFNIATTFTLTDMKALFVAWKNFLQSPPLGGSKA